MRLCLATAGVIAGEDWIPWLLGYRRALVRHVQGHSPVWGWVRIGANSTQTILVVEDGNGRRRVDTQEVLSSHCWLEGLRWE